MLIGLTIICLILALIFGKITYKEIKEYVRKHTEKLRNPKRGAGTRAEGDKEREEKLPEERRKEGKDRRA